MDVDGVELLTEVECRRLLACERIGRVAVAVGALAMVCPVNYLTAGEDILLWSGEGTKLRAAVADQTVTFEVDHIDPHTESGWSVLAVGMARERIEPSVLAGAKAAGLRSWADGDRAHLIAICRGDRVGPSSRSDDRLDHYGGRRPGADHTALADLRARPAPRAGRSDVVSGGCAGTHGDGRSLLCPRRPPHVGRHPRGSR